MLFIVSVINLSNDGIISDLGVEFVSSFTDMRFSSCSLYKNGKRKNKFIILLIGNKLQRIAHLHHNHGLQIQIQEHINTDNLCL